MYKLNRYNNFRSIINELNEIKIQQIINIIFSKLRYLIIFKNSVITKI